MNLEDKCLLFAKKLHSIAIHDSEGYNVMADEIADFTKIHIFATISEFLGENASDAAHFQAMNILDKVLGKK